MIKNIGINKIINISFNPLNNKEIFSKKAVKTEKSNSFNEEVIEDYFKDYDDLHALDKDDYELQTVNNKRNG